MSLMRDYISLCCAASDPTLGDSVIVYQIKGVYAEEIVGVNRSDDGQEPVNNTLVVVPFNAKCDENYVSPKVWENMNISQKRHNYTFKEGDTILVNQTPSGVTTIEQIKNKYDDCFDIQGIKKFDKVYPHFELTCK